MKTEKNQRWIDASQIDFEPSVNGIERRILAYTDELMTVENRFEVGGIGAMHNHPHTQITYVLSGKFSFTIDGVTKIVKQGDVMLKTNSVMHGCECLEAGSLLDIFTPMREDFISVVG